MPARPTPSADADALAALERLDAREVAERIVADATPEQRAVASGMRERDHLDGCPMPASRVEAMLDIVGPEPGVGIAGLGLRQGDPVLIVHCMECGAYRYLGGYPTMRDYLRDRLRALAGVAAPEPAEPLDTTL